MPALHPGQRKRGLTLIELLLFVVVVGIALSAMLRVFTTATQASADPVIRRQELAIAESMLHEVQLMPMTWCDPTDANVEIATSASGCASLAESLGPEPGESRYGPTYFNNVNDYAGFSMSGIRDIGNAAVAGLTGYAVSVAVAPTALDTLTAGGEALKITITVTGPDASTLVLQGWRTRYAPQSPY
ncbi:prepilin-type N-terminal cleavage/methylation domain-containing protein [Roseateles saccharophilus]|nr:type II secretion system protein [Roseateles saccharophilus]MDG0833634.1 type II secretion system protein [Roseateles saccharophilus]